MLEGEFAKFCLNVFKKTKTKNLCFLLLSIVKQSISNPFIYLIYISLDFLFVFTGCSDVFSLRSICKLNTKISNSKLTSYSKTGWRPLFAQHGEHQLLLYKWCVVISEGCEKNCLIQGLPPCMLFYKAESDNR